jgi:secreted PhoX family phosphatase
VSPRGGILLCEDDAIGDGDTHPVTGGLTEINRLVGLGAQGQVFTFAVNVLNNTEFAGSCFSPDGEILFVNIYGRATPGSGMTCAIRGPWTDGPL